MASQPPGEQSVGSSTDEWAARAADAVEAAVDTVHDKLVRPALVVGRAVVFGVVIVVVGIVVLVMLAVALVRLLDVYAFDGRVWASDALIGTLACGGGVVLWSLRARRRASER